MEINLDFLKNRLFYCEHLSVSETCKREISNTFSVKRDNAKGLERYIKSQSFVEEANGYARTFLVRDCETHEIACYFTLRAGLVAADEVLTENGRSFNSISGIELSEFAVNDTYRVKHPEVQHIGAIVFSCFIYPLALRISKWVGAYFLYVFAISSQSLLRYYKSLNFETPPDNDRLNIYRFFTPRYDVGCVLMCQKLVGECI